MEYFLIAISAFISSLAGAYLASYVKKKGENLATSEDIDDITRKIEEVKILFNHQTEEVKARLGVIGKYVNEYMAEKRQAYLDYIRALIHWSELCTSFRAGAVPWDNKQYVADTIIRFQEAHFKTNQQSAILAIYNDDVEFSEYIHQAEVAILTLQHHLEKFLENCLVLAFRWKISIDQSQDKLRAQQDYLDEKTRLNKECRDTIMSAAENIFPLKHEAIRRVKEMIKSIEVSKVVTLRDVS